MEYEAILKWNGVSNGEEYLMGDAGPGPGGVVKVPGTSRAAPRCPSGRT